MAADNIDLHNFMDVITSYKCKFCTFTCQFAQGIASHVKHVHLAQGDLTGTDVKIPALDRVVPVTSVGTCTSDAETEIGQSLPDDVGILRPTVAFVPTQDELESVPGIAVEQEQDIAAQYAEIVQEATQSMVTVSSVEEQTRNLAEVNQATGSLEEIEGNKPSELFLCGQCGVAFGTIDDCKQHMVEEHNVLLPQDQFEIGKVEASTHMDASTQVMPKKRPGRKKKVVPTPTPSVMINPAYSRAPLPEQVGLQPPVEAENVGKRRIRVPKALTDDYCLSKRVKIRRKTKELNKHCDLKCKFLNCTARFQLPSSLKIHQDCHNPNTEAGGFVCSQCKTEFLQWRTLRTHLWKEHQLDTDLFSCDAEDCNFKTDKVFKLNAHKEIHNLLKPYGCDKCPKSFRQLNQLRNHQVLHLSKSDPNDKKWYSNRNCDICGRSFSCLKSLNKHIEAVHSKIKPFICQFCGHTAARKAMLQLHLRTHTGEKPFQCDHCTYSTGDHNSLRRHRMRHTGQKPYQCQFCSYSCIQAISLKTHMKNKHQGLEGVFACPQCTYISVNKGSLENHLEDHKNGLIDTSNTSHPRQQKIAGIASASSTASAAQGQQTNVQTFTIQQDEQQAPQHVTVTAPSNADGVQTFFSNDTSAAQLIYSALNAIQQSQKNKTSGMITVDGMQATVTDNVTEGSSGHTITFHIPTSDSTDTGSPLNTLKQLPVSQAVTNVQDAINVAINTESIQNSLEGGAESVKMETVTEVGIAKQNLTDLRKAPTITTVPTEDLLNHAATMMTLRGGQEIVSLAAETADLPMKEEGEAVMDAQLVQISVDGTQILRSADGSQLFQVVTSDSHPGAGILQLASAVSGTHVFETDGAVLQAVPVSSLMTGQTVTE